MQQCTTTPFKAKIFSEDLQKRDALLRRDERFIRTFLYSDCFPLFKSIFDNYDTDCEDVIELMHEIYLLILTPSKTTNRCQLENYRGESSLMSWLKTVTIYFCYRKHELMERMPKYEAIVTIIEEGMEGDDGRNDDIYGSNEIDFDSLNRQDAMRIIGLMPNERYRDIIIKCHLEGMTNTETAKALGMTMKNFYNKHLLAKAQYEQVWRKEAQYV